MNKVYSLKVDIKTQPRDKYIKTVAIYMPLFRTGIPEAILKFVIIINNIIKGKDMSTVPHNYGMTHNLVILGSLRVF